MAVDIVIGRMDVIAVAVINSVSITDSEAGVVAVSVADAVAVTNSCNCSTL